jgi:hypothetical protein
MKNQPSLATKVGNHTFRTTGITAARSKTPPPWQTTPRPARSPEAVSRTYTFIVTDHLTWVAAEEFQEAAGGGVAGAGNRRHGGPPFGRPGSRM